MAHHKATLKSIRQTKTRTERNVQRRTRIKTFIKKVEAAVEEGSFENAQAALRTAQKELLRGVSKGILKLGTASRKISRLNAQVKSLAK